MDFHVPDFSHNPTACGVCLASSIGYSVFKVRPYPVTPTGMAILRKGGRRGKRGENPVLPGNVNGIAIEENCFSLPYQKDKQNYHMTPANFPTFLLVSLGTLLNKRRYREPFLLDSLVGNQIEGKYQRIY